MHPGVRRSEASDKALPEHMRTLQAILPHPKHSKHAPVPLGFIVEVRRLLCSAIPAREALKTYRLSAQDIAQLPIYKVLLQLHKAMISWCMYICGSICHVSNSLELHSPSP